MDGASDIVDYLTDELDILGQQPSLQIYTQICCCFSVPDGASSHSTIINTLTNGLERLSVSFPWISGQVINEGSSEGNSGIFKIKSLDKIPRLVVKDLRDEPSMPTMDALRRADFPMSMLDEDIIAPRKTLPGSPEEADCAPVFLLQATFITGGLLLTIVGHHMTMDMTGQGQMMHLLSKACHDEPFTSDELSSGNLTRRNLIPLLDDDYHTDRIRSELARQTLKPTSSDTNDHSAVVSASIKATWTYFTFNPHSLAALKSLANESLTQGYVSTDDALSAFIWRSVIRARLYRLSSTSTCTFGRAIDVRPYFSIPHTYPGLIQNMAYHISTPETLTSQPLGATASQLRAALIPPTSTLAQDTRALATFMHRSPDKSTTSFAATLDLSTDLMLSSWAKLDAYELEFGLGCGKPEAVRRPRFNPYESLLYLMPRASDGEIAVAVCLRDEDLEKLREDEDFMRYARHIG